MVGVVVVEGVGRVVVVAESVCEMVVTGSWSGHWRERGGGGRLRERDR